MEDNDNELPLGFQNELKKLKFTAERGAKFSENKDESISPDEEAKWLESMRLFEEAHDKNIVKKIKDIVGNPSFPSAEYLSEEQLPQALQELIDLLYSFQISLDVLYDQPERVIYKFITEELLEEDMEVIQVPGMFTCFIYEEFHPNELEDLKRYTEEFVAALVKKEFSFLTGMTSREMLYQGQKLPSEEYLETLELILEGKEMEIGKLEVIETKIEDSMAEVIFNLSYQVNHGIWIAYEEIAILKFEHELGYWMVSSVQIPGLDI